MKQTKPYALPGYTLYPNINRNQWRRGGIICMVKYHLARFIQAIDLTYRNQIWFTLSCFPGIQFGGVYIYPNGSPFYEDLNLHAKLVSNSSSIVSGDINARFWRDVVIHDANDIPITYVNKPDNGENVYGNRLISICQSSNVAIENNSAYKGRITESPMTYRQGSIWTSELDLVIITPSLMSNIENLQVDTDVKGSDHAPITISLNMKDIRTYTVSDLLERSQCLGMVAHDHEHISIPKSLNHHQICTATLSNLLAEITPPVIPFECIDVTATIKKSEEYIMQTAIKCKKPRKQQVVRDDVSFWERLLLLNESKSVWQAIDWKGKYNSQQPSSIPSDQAFKQHFESPLNGNCHAEINDAIKTSQNSPYIPLLDDPFEAVELEDAIKKLKPNKGYIGIAPGLRKNIPANWLIFFLGIFNLLFLGAAYPMHWCITKLVTIF